jgi:peptidoglycan/xylan/chitin deacetylase (PgdA/CDA1 family)
MIYRKKKYFFILVFIWAFLLFPVTGWPEILPWASTASGNSSDNPVIGSVNTLNPEEPSPQEEQSRPIEEPVQEVEPLQDEPAVRDENPKDLIDTKKIQTGPSKVAYLTFDDGPSPSVTPQVLEILRQYDIKASFFVIGQMAEGHPEIVRQIREEGHFVGNHTYSHNYRAIYAEPESFWTDVLQGEAVLQSILGEDFQTRIIRFPAGSFGNNKQPFREYVLDQGYHYIDWNALNGDAEAQNVPAAKLLQRIKETTRNKDRAIILMHDSSTKSTTVEALPEIIEYLQAQGYVFQTLEHYTFSHKLQIRK